MYSTIHYAPPIPFAINRHKERRLDSGDRMFMSKKLPWGHLSRESNRNYNFDVEPSSGWQHTFTFATVNLSTCGTRFPWEGMENTFLTEESPITLIGDFTSHSILRLQYKKLGQVSGERLA